MKLTQQEQENIHIRKLRKDRVKTWKNKTQSLTEGGLEPGTTKFYH